MRPLGTLGNGIYGGDAIYLFARLPAGVRYHPPAIVTYTLPPSCAWCAYHMRAAALSCSVGVGRHMHVKATDAMLYPLMMPAMPPKCMWSAGCEDDVAVNRWLVNVHNVAVIPGSGCGFPGHIRVAFGQPHPDAFVSAAARLKAGIAQLCAEGFGDTVGKWTYDH